MKSFATLADLLTELTSKKYSPTFPLLTEQQLIPFEELKLGLKQAPILHFPKANVLYTVDTDGSAAQIGWVPMRGHERRKNPIAY